MSNIHKDVYGRAIAACVPYSTASTLRFVGLYGPTAAMAPRFPSSIQGIREESALVTFLSDEMDLAFRKGWVFMAAGDLNSFPSLLLDREGVISLSVTNPLLSASSPEVPWTPSGGVILIYAPSHTSTPTAPPAGWTRYGCLHQPANRYRS
jgi:hypothetical protein